MAIAARGTFSMVLTRFISSIATSLTRWRDRRELRGAVPESLNARLDSPRILTVPGGVAWSTSAAERAKASRKDFIATTRYQNYPI